ncbi:hypothetical protein BD770DRAFT_329055, partial [Pilaira anomala]
LVGLISVLRIIEPDRSMMALGSDLSSLRLNLNSPHAIFSSFLSPWSDIQKLPGFSIEPGYYVPASYRQAKASPAAEERSRSFSDEALFYMFYTSPMDTIQAEAAKELFHRNWRYCKELKIWITKQVDEQGKAVEALEPTSENERATYGVFIMFDPIRWKREKRELTIIWETIELNL